MGVEEAIERWNQTLAKAAMAVEHIKEYSDPVEFEKSFENILKDQDVNINSFWKEEEFNGVPPEQIELLEKQIDDYRDLKGLMLQVYQNSPEKAGAMMDFNPDTVFSMINFHETAFGQYMGTYAKLTTNCLAIEIIKSFKNRELSEAEKLNNKVDELNSAGRYEVALSYSDKALSLSPMFCLAWINKGITLKNLERFDEAISCYDKAIEVNPRYKKAWHNKAVALLMKEELEEGSKCLDKALEIDPNYTSALNLKTQLERFIRS